MKVCYGTFCTETIKHIMINVKELDDPVFVLILLSHMCTFVTDPDVLNFTVETIEDRYFYLQEKGGCLLYGVIVCTHHAMHLLPPWSEHCMQFQLFGSHSFSKDFCC